MLILLALHIYVYGFLVGTHPSTNQVDNSIHIKTVRDSMISWP